MAVFSFEVNGESLRRNFSVYIVWVKKAVNEIYIGKTGDNRSGCNPLISRCGNHFSYNNIHSQIRNKIKNHENYTYKYYFVHFDKYIGNSDDRESINKINEMERWLNQKVQEVLEKNPKFKIKILNPLKSKKIIEKYRTVRNEEKLDELIECVTNDIKKYNNNEIDI